MPKAIASRSCSTASAGPSVSTTESPLFASIRRTASSTPHSSCGLMVKPRCWVLIARPSSVSRIRPPVIGTRLTQTAMRNVLSPDAGVLGVEEWRGPRDRDRHRVALAHVLDKQLVAQHRLLRCEVGHQDVLADRRPRPRTGHVRPASLPIDDPLAATGEDRLTGQQLPPLAAFRGLVVQ